jgi:hypothetical protein
MASKLDLWGTTSFAPGALLPTDLNDTFDALVQLVENGY